MTRQLLTGCISAGSGSGGGGGGGVTEEANLTHWWKMPSAGEASPPTSILDVATNGATRRDILNSNITVTSSGRTLGANTFDVYEFNGSSGRSYNVNDSTFFGDKISFSVWCKFDSRTHYETIFCSGITNGGWNDGLMLYVGVYGSGDRPSNTLAWCSGGYTSTAGASVAYVTLPGTGTWFHLAGVLDQAAGVQELYLDGVAGTSPGSVVSPGTFNSSYKMSVGALAWGASSGGYYFDGQMSDFRIYHDFALTGSDVAAIYAGDFAP